MAENEKRYDFEVGGIYYKFISNKRVAVTNETGNWKAKSYSGDVVIPREVTYKGVDYQVTEIGDMAFWGCMGLTSVEIPDSVTRIWDSAFSGCTSLKYIQVDSNNGAYCDIEGVLFSKDKKQLVAYPNDKSNEYSIPDSVTGVGECTFYDCKNLASVEIPNSVIEIGDFAFSGCESLTSVVIPNSVTKIGRSAFSFCTKLTSVVIPNSVTEIGSHIFYTCTSLTSVVIPDNVTEISEFAFYDCKNLASVVIPDSVTEIDENAFYGCTGLTSVVIPDSVTEIGDEAFWDCDNLKEVTCKVVVPPSVGWMSFSTYETLYVPKATLEAYREDEEWGQFKEILPIEE